MSGSCDYNGSFHIPAHASQCGAEQALVVQPRDEHTCLQDQLCRLWLEWHSGAFKVRCCGHTADQVLQA